MPLRQPVWIEAALNGPWGRDLQPGIPITIDEIVADAITAADAGAAIIHFHAYDPETGRQNDDWQTYARAIERVRAARDVIVYPTIPLAGGPDADQPLTPEVRFAAVEALARRGLIEWTVVDPGSAQFTNLLEAREGGTTGFLYANPEDHVRYGLALCAKHNLVPSYAIYELGFTRLGAALAQAASCPAPLYRFMFSDGFSFGTPPRAYGLAAHLALLEDVAPGAHWMTAGLDVDITPLIPDTVTRGGHLRAGLEDARLGETRTNLDLVTELVTQVETLGATIATPSDVRAALVC